MTCCLIGYYTQLFLKRLYQLKSDIFFEQLLLQFTLSVLPLFTVGFANVPSPSILVYIPSSFPIFLCFLIYSENIVLTRFHVTLWSGLTLIEAVVALNSPYLEAHNSATAACIYSFITWYTAVNFENCDYSEAKYLPMFPAPANFNFRRSYSMLKLFSTFLSAYLTKTFLKASQALWQNWIVR